MTNEFNACKSLSGSGHTLAACLRGVGASAIPIGPPRTEEVWALPTRHELERIDEGEYDAQRLQHAQATPEVGHEQRLEGAARAQRLQQMAEQDAQHWDGGGVDEHPFDGNCLRACERKGKPKVALQKR